MKTIRTRRSNLTVFLRGGESEMVEVRLGAKNPDNRLDMSSALCVIDTGFEATRSKLLAGLDPRRAKVLHILVHDRVMRADGLDAVARSASMRSSYDCGRTRSTTSAESAARRQSGSAPTSRKSISLWV